MTPVVEALIQTFAASIRGVQCSEANAQALLFHACLQHGYTPRTACCEFYPGPGQSERADLALFDAECNGRFSWYERGEKALDNTALKARSLEHLIEIKGGYKTERTVLGRLQKWLDLFLDGKVKRGNPLADVDKLTSWRHQFGPDKQYHFVCVDFPEPRSIDNTRAVEQIGHLCVDRGISFVYVDAHTGDHVVRTAA